MKTRQYTLFQFNFMISPYAIQNCSQVQKSKFHGIVFLDSMHNVQALERERAPTLNAHQHHSCVFIPNNG